MTLSEENQEQIALIIIQILYSKFGQFPDDATQNRNAPFHEALLQAFSEKLTLEEDKIPIRMLISLSSWLHGLNTTLGMTLFEKVPQLLSGGYKRAFTEKEKTTLKIKQTHKNAVSTIITALTNGNKLPSIIEENELIFKDITENEVVDATDFTADIFIENEKEIVCLEVKTVNPNKGTSKGEKTKILEAKAALKVLYPHKEIKYFFCFPFDPYSGTACGKDKNAFIRNSVDLKKYFAEDEILLADEFWNYVSENEETMEDILTIIRAIAEPDFLNKYQYLQNRENIDKPEYLNKPEYLDIVNK